MATELTNPQTDRSALGVEGRTFEITKAVSFEAAYYHERGPEGDVYRHVKGHSFRLEATVAGKVPADAEWVHDISDLTARLEETAGKLDHCLLNEIPGLSAPTLERLAVWIANDLKPCFPGLKQVTVIRPGLDERCVLILD